MKTYKIGRLTGNDICYNNDQISRQHADLTYMDDGRIVLTDHSKNGTTVNGRSLNNTTMEIHRGDNVVFAGVQRLDWNSIPYMNSSYIQDEPVSSIQPSNGMAITGFVLAFIFPVLGLLFSIIGLNRSKEMINNKGRGLAIAGIVISSVSLVIALLVKGLL